MNRLTRLVAAVSTVLLGTSLGVSVAFADSSTPTVENPGGIEAPHSPGGIPSGAQGPDKHTFVGALLHAQRNPGTVPMGANDFSCVPTPGKNPVVLIPGTSSDAFTAWAFFAPRLKQAGYCVYTFNYNPSISKNFRGKITVNETAGFSGDIRQSAAFMAGFVDKVLASTGAAKVDVVGHSQGGGVLPRAYIKWYGGATKINHLIGLVPNNHGTTMMGMRDLFNSAVTKWPRIKTEVLDATNQQSLLQQLEGSQFLTELNEGGMTYPDIKYTVISTRVDTTITPYTNAFIEEPGVTNMTLQDFCPADAHGHANMPYSDVALQLTLEALDDGLGWQLPLKCFAVAKYLHPDEL